MLKSVSSANPALSIKSNSTTGVLQITGPADGTTRIMTVPNANFTAARIDAAQSFTGDQTLANGNLVQGTAAKGVNFTANTPSAGMTSRLLNWYEEGTWTPADASGASLTLTISSAIFTRIGNMVTINAVVSYPNTADGSNAKIGGLPYAAATNPPVLIAQYSNVAVLGYIASTTINLVQANNYTTAVTNASLSTNGVLISASYLV